MLLRRRRPRDGNRAVPRERLPAVNSHVKVTTGGSSFRPSRVEDLAGDLVVLSWPTDPAGYRLTATPGDTVAITWTSESGVHELDGTIVDTGTEPVPSWSVRALAAPPAHQRREAFRLDVRLPLALRPRDASGDAGAGPDAAGEPVEATTFDLSEGGLGFVVARDAAPDEGAPVLVTFPIDDGDISLAATVVRVGEASAGECSGGMRFDDVTEEAATRLRRFVLQEQIRRRSLVRD